MKLKNLYEKLLKKYGGKKLHRAKLPSDTTLRFRELEDRQSVPIPLDVVRLVWGVKLFMVSLNKVITEEEIKGFLKSRGLPEELSDVILKRLLYEGWLGLTDYEGTYYIV